MKNKEFQHGVRIGFLPAAISHDLWVDLYMIYTMVEFNKSSAISKSYKNVFASIILILFHQELKYG